MTPTATSTTSPIFLFRYGRQPFLIEHGGLDIQTSPIIGLVVDSRCRYHAPVAFPDQLEAGLRVDRLGNRSVTYGIAIFAQDITLASAHGYFVHVFVDRNTNQSAAIPATMRQALQTITA